MTSHARIAQVPKILKGVRLLSLALNLPGPAALMRCQQMGARCRKLEPPSGDPMRHYSPGAYAQLHDGVSVLAADLKTEAGQETLHKELAKADVLITSFRPSAIEKLGLGWKVCTVNIRHCRRSSLLAARASAPRSRATI